MSAKINYNWIIAELYLDVDLKNGSVQRINKYITLREFRNRVQSGESFPEMVKSGVSKKIIQFFSNFCQGKIGVTKDEFILDYSHTGKSLEEIAKEHNISREDITYLRQLYNIKRTGATFINRKKNDIPLTSFQKEMIYGSLMGDAKRQNPKHLSSVAFGQGDPQEEYLKWKASILYNLISENALKHTMQYDVRYNKKYGSWRFYTVANTEIETILTEFYLKGKKSISKKILDELTPFSLAVWFMDDGVTDWRHRDKIKGKDSKQEVKFCTDSFTIEECDLIVNWLKEKYNINSHWRYHKKEENRCPRIVIQADSVDLFLSLIRPHIIPSMLYKVDYEEWKKKNLAHKMVKVIDQEIKKSGALENYLFEED